MKYHIVSANTVIDVPNDIIFKKDEAGNWNAEQLAYRASCTSMGVGGYIWYANKIREWTDENVCEECNEFICDVTCHCRNDE